MRRVIHFIAAVLVFGPVVAEAAPEEAYTESLGKLELSDLLIEPVFQLNEPKLASFGLGNSYLAAIWKRDNALSAEIKVGSRDLLGRPRRYGLATDNELALVEAYAQYDSVYGRIRAGLIPIAFSSQGGDAEARLSLTRSLLFRNRQVNLRDYGLSYRLTNEGFFSDWAIHNGEGGRDLDNETWFTARWGYEGGRFFRAGVSGSAGRTSPSSTNPLGVSSSVDAGLDVDEIARIRIANFFFDWESAPVRIEFQATGGDTRQGDDISKFRTLNADFIIAAGESLSWILRYDTFDPKTDAGGDLVTEATAGLAWRTRYDNSVLYLLGTKRWLQDTSSERHALLVMWRVTPSAVGYRTAL